MLSGVTYVSLKPTLKIYLGITTVLDVTWTFNLVLDNMYKEEIDNINNQLKEQGVVDTVKLVEYVELDEKESSIVVPCDILVGDVRDKVYNLLMQSEKNRGNIWLQNINFSKDDVSLKHRFSVWITENNFTEARHMGMNIKDGAVIKIGVKVPVFYKTILRLNKIKNNMLDENDEKHKLIATEIESIVDMIRNEAR